MVEKRKCAYMLCCYTKSAKGMVHLKGHGAYVVQPARKGWWRKQYYHFYCYIEHLRYDK